MAVMGFGYHIEHILLLLIERSEGDMSKIIECAIKHKYSDEIIIRLAEKSTGDFDIALETAIFNKCSKDVLLCFYKRLKPNNVKSCIATTRRQCEYLISLLENDRDDDFAKIIYIAIRCFTFIDIDIVDNLVKQQTSSFIPLIHFASRSMRSDIINLLIEKSNEDLSEILLEMITCNYDTKTIGLLLEKSNNVIPCVDAIVQSRYDRDNDEKLVSVLDTIVSRL